MVILAENLVKYYRNIAALQGVGLSVKDGEAFGLVGPNGAGKTTAISIICGLLKPDRGRVLLFGQDMSRHKASIKRRISLVPQDLALYPDLTARENLAYFGRLYGLSGRSLKNRVRDCLESCGLSLNADRRVADYSGGMKRRVNLAIGLLNKPRLLILDEPTVGIDVQSRNAILEHLESLNRQGMTLIYTTHYMEEVERLCSRIAIMDEGRILRTGSRDELLAAHPSADNLEKAFLELTGKALRD
jgi:ABC-2 type transport system ATP-binding protein